MKQIFQLLAFLSSFVLISRSAELRKIRDLIGDEKVNITGAYANVDVDIVWYSYQDIEINVIEFLIDIQSGDFVLISEYMLWNFSTARPEIPIRDYVLVGESQPEFNTTYQLVNPIGVSIYFHGTFTTGQRRECCQKGIIIEVGLIDKTVPEVVSTTETIIAPPDPETGIYLIKFLTGKTPAQFVQDLRSFRQTLADMTNDYCAYKNIPLQDEAGEQDVSVPQSYLRYCDRSWPPYDNCVEVGFAVAVYANATGEYLMDTVRLDEMWSLFAKKAGLTEYIPPEYDNIGKPTAWLGAFLGFILVILPILIIIWLKTWSDGYIKQSTTSVDGLSPGQNESNVITTFFDRENPAYKAPKQKTELRGFDNQAFVFDQKPVYRDNRLFAENYTSTNQIDGNKSEFSSEEDEVVQHYPQRSIPPRGNRNYPSAFAPESTSQLY